MAIPVNISNTTVVQAIRPNGVANAFLRRKSDGYTFYSPMPSIDAVRRTWHAFVQQHADAEEMVSNYNPHLPDRRFIELWDECIASKPWEKKIDVLKDF